MDMLNKITKTRTGRIVLGVVIVGAIVFGGYQLMGLFGTSPEVASANDRVFICSETGRSFHMNLQKIEGASIPIRSPYSNKDTGYPAELCYWTEDGQSKSEPTAVLLNSSIGVTDPTFCPDCGRLVVGHNPVPQPGRRPPPTRAELASRSEPQPGANRDR